MELVQPLCFHSLELVLGGNFLRLRMLNSSIKLPATLSSSQFALNSLPGAQWPLAELISLAGPIFSRISVRRFRLCHLLSRFEFSSAAKPGGLSRSSFSDILATLESCGPSGASSAGHTFVSGLIQCCLWLLAGGAFCRRG